MANYAARLPSAAHKGYFFPGPPYEKGYVRDNMKPYTRVRWKASCFANKVRYIGNVYITSEGSEDMDKSERLPDSVFKSDPGKYDTFRPYRRIDVATGDGEDIIALEIFADRLLQFKQNTLHIINIQGDAEFLEDVFNFKGVESPMAVVKTDFGVAWVNKQGVYLYNGQGGVTNLLEKNAQRLIRLSTDTIPAQIDSEPWDTFVTDKTGIGYSPLHRKIFVRKAVGHGAYASYSTASADMYIFDITSQSWTYHEATTGTDPEYDCSGFFVDAFKDLVFFQENAAGTGITIDKWNTTPTATDKTGFWTKCVDFGDPYAPKVIYEIGIRCKNGSNMPVHISTDGGETKTSIGNLGTGATAYWKKLSTNLPISGVNEVMIGFNTASAVSANANFEVYEINIVHRRKKVTSLT